MLTTVDGNGNPVLGKRYAAGRYSWFATLVPLDPIDKTSADIYRLSTAIVAERNTYQPTEVIPVTEYCISRRGIGNRQPEPARGALDHAGGQDTGTGVGEGNYGWYRIIRKNDNVVTLSGMLIPAPRAADVYALPFRTL